jgi:hypothetical protein
MTFSCSHRFDRTLACLFPSFGAWWMSRWKLRLFRRRYLERQFGRLNFDGGRGCTFRDHARHDGHLRSGAPWTRGTVTPFRFTRDNCTAAATG